MTNLPFTGEFKVTCEYRRQNSKTLKWAAGFHTGIDLVGVSDKNIYSICDGIVTMASACYGAYGKAIKIKDKKTGNIFLFAHLSKLYVKKGQSVSRTTRIGLMGSSGNVSGPHLHLEMRRSSDLYGVVLDIAKYMGIHNLVGTYNSKDYQLDPSKYKAGQKVLIDMPIAFTGAYEGDKMLVQSGSEQFWINKSVVVNYSRIYGLGTIIMNRGNRIYECEIFNDKFLCREEYISDKF